MAQLKARIARVEDQSGVSEREQSYDFGGDILIQDFEPQESDEGEVAEVLKGEVRRLFVLHRDYTAKAGERIVGFEPSTITQTGFKLVLTAIMNTSRSI